MAEYIEVRVENLHKWGLELNTEQIETLSKKLKNIVNEDCIMKTSRIIGMWIFMPDIVQESLKDSPLVTKKAWIIPHERTYKTIYGKDGIQMAVTQNEEDLFKDPEFFMISRCDSVMLTKNNKTIIINKELMNCDISQDMLFNMLSCQEQEITEELLKKLKIIISSNPKERLENKIDEVFWNSTRILNWIQHNDNSGSNSSDNSFRE
uniref:24 kDa protein n=1 Tax=Citrus psorosis virus TaxID=73561 RepID=Q80H97_9VIRU|nr:24 kDa protein [Citrus psorosis virus]